MPELSIVTVNLNNAEGLEKTIRSVIQQTCSDYELIIVDGASTDGSINIIEKYRSNIKFFVSEPDHGVYDAMNKGIEASAGNYCLFLNSGDFFFDNEVVGFFIKSHSNAAIVYGNSYKIKPHYRRVIRYSSELTLYDFYKTEPGLHHQATFIRRDLFAKYGNYNNDIKIIADWEFFFRVIILNQVKAKYLDRIISAFDATGISNSLRPGDARRDNANRIKYDIIDKNFPDIVVDDYKRLDSILSKQSVLRKIMNKVIYFSFQR